MTEDIFDNPILCKKCKKQMKPGMASRNGFNLRILRCDKCKEAIVHPLDKQEYTEFMKLKRKDFEVKMRMVGNSYAVSIPREIVDFMREQEKMINDMVRLSFDDAQKLSLMFNTPKSKSRVVRSKEVRVVKGNKPVYHAKEYYDSAHPEKSKKVVKHLKKKDEEIENDK